MVWDSLFQNAGMRHRSKGSVHQTELLCVTSKCDGGELLENGQVRKEPNEVYEIPLGPRAISHFWVVVERNLVSFNF